MLSHYYFIYLFLIQLKVIASLVKRSNIPCGTNITSSCQNKYNPSKGIISNNLTKMSLFKRS